jgi:transposase InsO family protein
LALVHSDICGPFRTPSLGGARYFISFINDFSRFTWVYFITRKSEALTKFKTFVAEVTSQGGHIQCLRSDNGGEYKSADFDNYCTLNGISRQFTVPYSPQQNGVSERRNRSLLDITRCMLLDKDLPHHLWREAICAASGILNLRSTKRHPAKTPFELFTGKKPSVAHLRVFGSQVFFHGNQPNRGKLDPHSQEGVLLS